MTKTYPNIFQEIIFFLFLALVIPSFFIWQNNKNFGKKFLASLPILEGREKNIVSPVFNSTLDQETATQVSPDGTKKLNLKILHNSDLTKTYTFTVSNSFDKDKKVLFSQTLAQSESMGLPFNAWSPDNKYVFLYKNDSDALIFKATGESLTAKENYLSLQEVFKEKNKTLVLSEATGWASETLLIVNALNSNNQKSSFWLEIPSKAVIPLASQF